MNILTLAVNEFGLDLLGAHGLPHWQRVEKIGLYLAEHTDADRDIIRLFAYLHDAKRETDDIDPDHGKRAAELARSLHSRGVLDFGYAKLGQLIYICANHNLRLVKTVDITAQTCWDADRLDLWRVGEVPNPEFLYTKVAKRPDTIEFSRKLFYDSPDLPSNLTQDEI
ncbi:MAG: hypothetical protein RIQ54_72 [Candidatus Parcubacteria bacterium]|jgi:uncharacterized protein